MEEYNEESSSKKLRQKAISLLYLLFIALVFIYVPSDFLDSINEANRSFEHTEDELKDLKKAKYQMFETPGVSIGMGNLVDSFKYKRISSLTDSLIGDIENLKNFLLERTGGLNKYGYPAKSKEFDVTDQLLLNTSRASDLKAAIENYKTSVRPYLLDAQKPLLDSLLPIKNRILNSKGNFISWEKFYFRKAPLSVTLMMLSKFQSEARMLEYLVLDRYQRDLMEAIFVRSGLQNLAMADSSKSVSSGQRLILKEMEPLVNLGQEVMVMAQLKGMPADSLRLVRAFIQQGGNEIPLEIDSLGLIRFRPSEIGDYQISASYRNQDTLSVGVRVVSPKPIVRKKNMEVVYVGIRNPLRVSFTNMNVANINIEATRGRTRKVDSLYYLQVEREGPLKITVKGRVNGKEVVLHQKQFLAKKLPVPFGLLNGKRGGEMLDRVFKSQEKIEVKSDLFESEGHYFVKEFSLTRLSSDGLIINKSPKNVGGTLNSTSKQIVKQAQKGDLYVFNNIIVVGSDGEKKDVPAMVFEIK